MSHHAPLLELNAECKNNFHRNEDVAEQSVSYLTAGQMESSVFVGIL